MSYKSNLGTLHKLESAITESVASRFSLPAAVPEFIPTVELGGVSQIFQRLAIYDGKTAWDAYYTQFELLSQMNQWSNQEKSPRLCCYGPHELACRPTQ